MPGITIRLAPRAYQLIKEAAHHEGITTTQFLREAALLRAWILKLQRDNIDFTAPATEIRAWLEAQDQRRR